MKLRWWTPLIPLRSIARSLRSIDATLKRLADASEGVTPAKDLGDAPTEVLPFTDYAAAFAIEERLRAQLKRDPTPEEILQDLEGREHWGADGRSH